MEKQSSKKIWIILVILLSVVCIVQGVFLFIPSLKHSPGDKVFDNFDRFSSYLEDKYQKEKKDSFHLFDRFFNDNFFSGRIDPFEEMERMHQQMEDMMGLHSRNRFLDSWNGWFGERFLGSDSGVHVDVKDKSDAYIINIDIPNLKENRLNIDINKNGIFIDGEFSQAIERKDNQGKVIAKHDMWQSFSRKIPIPNGADYESATVDNKKDKIIIRLPKINA